MITDPITSLLGLTSFEFQMAEMQGLMQGVYMQYAAILSAIAEISYSIEEDRDGH